MDQKQVHQEKLEAQLREWDGMWQVAKARAARKIADAKLGGLDQLDRLEKTRAEAASKLASLKASADDSWEEMKAQLEGLWSELSDGMRAINEKLHASDEETKRDDS